MTISGTTPTVRRPRPRSLVAAVLLALVTLLVGALPASAVTQASAESQFRAAGITWSSSGGCTDRYNSTCTSFDGIRQTTIDGAVTLRRASGCALNITGGTEVGHASGTYSHFNGWKLDFSKTTCLTSYVHANFTYIGLRGDGYPMWKSGAGNVYTDEGSHWDVLYYNCGGC